MNCLHLPTHTHTQYLVLAAYSPYIYSIIQSSVDRPIMAFVLKTNKKHMLMTFLPPQDKERMDKIRSRLINIEGLEQRLQSFSLIENTDLLYPSTLGIESDYSWDCIHLFPGLYSSILRIVSI